MYRAVNLMCFARLWVRAAMAISKANAAIHAVTMPHWMFNQPTAGDSEQPKVQAVWESSTTRRAR